jgi:hypothetical protein
MNVLRGLAALSIVITVDAMVTNKLPMTTILLVTVLLYASYKILDDLVDKPK